MPAFDQQTPVGNDCSFATDHFDTAIPSVCGNGNHDVSPGGLGVDGCLTRSSHGMGQPVRSFVMTSPMTWTAHGTSGGTFETCRWTPR